MEILGIIFVVIGLLVCLIAGIMYIVIAFREHVGWGLCILFQIPFVSLIFLIKFWEEAKQAFFLYLLGIALFFVGFFAGAGDMIRSETSTGLGVPVSLQELTEAAGLSGDDDSPPPEHGSYVEDPQHALIGLEPIEVRRVLGNPTGEFESKGDVTWHYPGQFVTFTGGRVVDVEPR